MPNGGKRLTEANTRRKNGEQQNTNYYNKTHSFYIYSKIEYKTFNDTSSTIVHEVSSYLAISPNISFFVMRKATSPSLKCKENE